MYPMLAGFRALVESDMATGMYCWKKDPFKTYSLLREQLASKAVKFAESIGNNPNVVGRDSNVWDILYMTVERAV